MLSAIKWFMALVLFGEKDKENKIKENKKNLFDYLNIVDLWKKDIYKDINFIKELNALKKFNIQINKIIWLYDYLEEEEEEEKEEIEDDKNKNEEEVEKKDDDESDEDDDEKDGSGDEDDKKSDNDYDDNDGGDDYGE